MMDMRTLKVGQRVCVQITSSPPLEATVEKITEDYVQMVKMYNPAKDENGFAVDFYYNGRYNGLARLYGWIDGLSDHEYTVVTEDNICKFCIGKYSSFSYRWTAGEGVMMDMRALKRGQHITLSDVLPGVLSNGRVTEITKGHVSVQVDALIGSTEGAYLVEFDYDGNVIRLYDWIETDTPGYYVEFSRTRPVIPGLKIIGLKEDAA
jgi:hypothetical protein